MKIFFSLFLFCSFLGIAQSTNKYILLDSLTQKYPTQKYTINTLAYGYEQGIDLYNVWINPNKLLLLSVLPDLDKGDKWRKVNEREFSQPISSQQLLSESKQIYYLLKKEGGTLYKSKMPCSVQIFKVGNYPPPLHFQGKDVINLGLPFVSYNEVKAAYKKIYPDRQFFFETDEVGVRDVVPKELETIYLSHIEERKGNKVYRFWTFAEEVGISRFAFIEGKGIVGVSYDRYFVPYGKYTGKYPISTLNNKEIMWAEEFK